MYFNFNYILYILPAVLFSLWANYHVNHTYKKYSKQYSSRRIIGADAALQILKANGIYDVGVCEISGTLTDHYDSKRKMVCLSSDVYYGSSVAAIGIASHEIGHVIQHNVGYMPIKIRTAIVPITNFGSKMAMPLILLGIVLSYFSTRSYEIIYLGIACFGMSTVFQLVTLPTEFNASWRAMNSIKQMGLLVNADEVRGARKVLFAAAMTYVAALAVSLMQLLRLIMIFGGRRRN